MPTNVAGKKAPPVAVKKPQGAWAKGKPTIVVDTPKPKNTRVPINSEAAAPEEDADFEAHLEKVDSETTAEPTPAASTNAWSDTTDPGESPVADISDLCVHRLPLVSGFVVACSTTNLRGS